MYFSFLPLNCHLWWYFQAVFILVPLTAEDESEKNPPLIPQSIIANLITMTNLGDYGHFKSLVVQNVMVSSTHNSLFPPFFFSAVICSSLPSLRCLLNSLSYTYVVLEIGVLEDSRCLCWCCGNSAPAPAAFPSARHRKVVLNRIQIIGFKKTQQPNNLLQTNNNKNNPSRRCFSSCDRTQTEIEMPEKKENMDIMSGAPGLEKILGYKFFIPFSPVDSALRRGTWMGRWTQEQWDGIRLPSAVGWFVQNINCLLLFVLPLKVSFLDEERIAL